MGLLLGGNGKCRQVEAIVEYVTTEKRVYVCARVCLALECMVRGLCTLYTSVERGRVSGGSYNKCVPGVCLFATWK